MKKVLLTGGSRGIGLCAARLFAEANYDVTVLSRRFSDFPLAEAENVHAVVCDIACVGELDALIQRLGDFDILVNNAGIMNSLPLDEYPPEDEERLMNVNLYAPIELMRLLSRGMKKNGFGRIVNTASVAGQIGHSDIWYGVSKAGIINATKSFAKLLAPFGITVNAVAPGPVNTDMLEVIPLPRREYVKSSVYSGRFAEPEEVARAIFWLATDCPEYINGICLDINNGTFPR